MICDAKFSSGYNKDTCLSDDSDNAFSASHGGRKRIVSVSIELSDSPWRWTVLHAIRSVAIAG